MVDTT